LESATPKIRAIGICDYYNTRTYQRVCEEKNHGRLKNCEMVFPNIEMRLKIGTVKGRWVNIHLLVNPEASDHLTELNRFLSRLTFDAFEDSFSCCEQDLIRLGNCVDQNISDSTACLECGSLQFKVSFDQLKDLYSKSAWAQQNVLIAVPGSETDGTSGVRDAADATLRQEIEKFAHIIFASSVAQREFWLGQRNATLADLQQRYGGPKPCMHGCDAHSQQDVGVPDDERYSWIKGAIVFDSLRQACVDPFGRAYVGIEPPVSSTPSQIIERIEIKDASWVETPTLSFNPGLVSIIGARGSGKTALADIIALGCDATAERLSSSSFLVRAQELLYGSSVSLSWQAGDTNVSFRQTCIGRFFSALWELSR
jgi:hypothetical protein